MFSSFYDNRKNVLLLQIMEHKIDAEWRVGDSEVQTSSKVPNVEEMAIRLW